MTDLDPATPSDLLRTEPTTVAGAFDVYTRLSTLESWVADRKRAVRDWTQGLAEARKAEDGAAPTWRLDGGSVTLTDPQPTPRITDAEAFVRWWLESVEGTDPDLYDDDYDEFAFETALGKIVRRRVAAAASGDLLDFLRRLAAPADDCDVAYAAAHTLAETLQVDVEWVLPADALDVALAPPSKDARVKVVKAADGWAMIDTDGERVPGVTVAPPGKPAIQVRPSTEVKERLRAELDDVIGPAPLTE